MASSRYAGGLVPGERLRGGRPRLSNRPHRPVLGLAEARVRWSIAAALGSAGRGPPPSWPWSSSPRMRGRSMRPE